MMSLKLGLHSFILTALKRQLLKRIVKTKLYRDYNCFSFASKNNFITEYSYKYAKKIKIKKDIKIQRQVFYQ